VRIFIVVSLASLVCAPVLAAQSPSARDAFYRCRDAAGQIHYGDSKPVACEGLDTEVLSDHGTVLRVIEGTQTRIEREKREASEVAMRKEREARQLRDRMLIETYLAVDDIERLRDQRLEMLNSQYRITEQNIQDLRERQDRLAQQISRFKPYSDRPNAPQLPDHLAEEMVNTVNGMKVYQETLDKTRAEQAEVRASFEADIARFKELKGIK
jgi:hypothetical protein